MATYCRGRSSCHCPSHGITSCREVLKCICPCSSVVRMAKHTKHALAAVPARRAQQLLGSPFLTTAVVATASADCDGDLHHIIYWQQLHCQYHRQSGKHHLSSAHLRSCFGCACTCRGAGLLSTVGARTCRVTTPRRLCACSVIGAVQLHCHELPLRTLTVPNCPLGCHS